MLQNYVNKKEQIVQAYAIKVGNAAIDVARRQRIYASKKKGRTLNQRTANHRKLQEAERKFAEVRNRLAQVEEVLRGSGEG